MAASGGAAHRDPLTPVQQDAQRDCAPLHSAVPARVKIDVTSVDVARRQSMQSICSVESLDDPSISNTVTSHSCTTVTGRGVTQRSSTQRSSAAEPTTAVTSFSSTQTLPTQEGNTMRTDPAPGVQVPRSEASASFMSGGGPPGRAERSVSFGLDILQVQSQRSQLLKFVDSAIGDSPSRQEIASCETKRMPVLQVELPAHMRSGTLRSPTAASRRVVSVSETHSEGSAATPQDHTAGLGERLRAQGSRHFDDEYPATPTAEDDPDGGERGDAGPTAHLRGAFRRLLSGATRRSRDREPFSAALGRPPARMSSTSKPRPRSVSPVGVGTRSASVTQSLGSRSASVNRSQMRSVDFPAGPLAVESKGLLGASLKVRWCVIKGRWLEEHSERPLFADTIPQRCHDLFCAHLRDGPAEADIEVVGPYIAPPGVLRLRAEDSQSAARWRELLSAALHSPHCDPTVKADSPSCLRSAPPAALGYDERRRLRVAWLKEGLQRFYQERREEGRPMPDVARLADNHVFEEFKLYVRLAVRYRCARDDGALEWMLHPPEETKAEQRGEGDDGGVDLAALEEHELLVAALESRVREFYQLRAPPRVGQERSVALTYIGREAELRAALEKHHGSSADLDRLFGKAQAAKGGGSPSRLLARALSSRQGSALDTTYSSVTSCGTEMQRDHSRVKFDPSVPAEGGRPHRPMQPALQRKKR
eukprot:TRINITY_DN11179_c0_g1_i1.p1 TRINITY_DN11179_c0_g1~~TRINITY_DN11179_c0_g1_i1.p1  ORF type:complete len:743 (+),score=126.33 TRINITY_DN11179_c0_g1_i1:112-2229(+)